jgi:cytochrome d ubiquinol oxidase subunit II
MLYNYDLATVWAFILAFAIFAYVVISASVSSSQR